MAEEISLDYKRYLLRVLEKSKNRKAKETVQIIPEDGIFCDICNNTGMVCETESDGHQFMKPCSKCYAKRQVARRLRASGISPEDYARYTLETYDASRSEESLKIKQMAQAFLKHHGENKQGFGVFGSSGTGKTHICIAVCQELTRKFGEPHYYFSYRSEIPTLIKALRSYEEEYEDILYKWKTCKNLYIDDLLKCAGQVKQVAEKGSVYAKLISIDKDDLRIMFDILNARYLNHLTTIFSGEYSINDISKIDSALASRIYEMIEPYGLTVHGKNQRLIKKTEEKK